VPPPLFSLNMRMPGDLVIGIDASTTATKAIAWDRDGRALAEGRAPIPIANPKPGWWEQDPEDWWSSTVKALKDLLGHVDANTVAALAISNQRETFGVFDQEGRPLRPGTVWLDQRSHAEVERLVQAVGAERIHRISGKPADVTPCLYRFLWLATNERETWLRADKVAEVHGFLAFKLTGEWSTSTASADPAGALDMERMEWSCDLLSAAETSIDVMPRLYRPGEIMAAVTEAASSATGLRAGTPVVAGGGDGQCAGTGTNVLESGRAYANLGTAVVSGNFATRYATGKAFRTMTAVAEQGYIYEAVLRTGTFLVNWFVQEFLSRDPRSSGDIFKTLEREAAAVPIGANGLIAVPYWGACMTPYWDDNARGVIAGLSDSTKRADVYRALLEGIALELSMITHRIMKESGAAIDHYVAIGGGAASDLWCQILADASGLPVDRLTTVEASSLGAGMAAAKGAGWYRSVGEAAAAMSGKPVARFEPDLKRNRRYAELLAIYEDLWPTISQWNARLTRFAREGQQ
jgi:sugar (pentulose or hexulose) kinase